MIKFLRKIRQQLLTENLPGRQAGKFSKYILYAIGEIVLVVIGILIALWLNTLNQEKAQHNKIDSILVKIQNDILQDIDNARPLPKVIRLTSVANTKDAEEFVGIYQFSNGYRNVLNSETIEVYLKDKDLYIKGMDFETGPLLQLHVEKPIFSKRYGYIVRFIPDRNTIRIYFGTNGINEWTKVTSK